MAIARWDPFGEITSMQKEMDRLFSRLGQPVRGGDGERVNWMPKIDVMSRGEDLVIRAELPGMKSEDVDISVTDNVLTLRGERKEEKKTEEEGYIVRESAYGTFSRSVVLPEGVNPDEIMADYKDGVLEIVVPNAAAISQPQTKKIAIGAGAK